MTPREYLGRKAIVFGGVGRGAKDLRQVDHRVARDGEREPCLAPDRAIERGDRERARVEDGRQRREPGLV